VQCAAHAVRALAVLPAPASPRRRATCVFLSLPPRRLGRAVAPIRAAKPSSPPSAAPAAQPTGASAGKAAVPDDEFSLAKVHGPGYFLLLGTWSLRLGRCHTEQSSPWVLNRWSFVGVLRCDWAGSWDLAPVVSSEFFSSLIRLRYSECPVMKAMCACISGMDSARISTCFPARSGQRCC
jgi:hypothetical protein